MMARSFSHSCGMGSEAAEYSASDVAAEFARYERLKNAPCYQGFVSGSCGPRLA